MWSSAAPKLDTIFPKPAIAALKGPFVGQRGAQYQIFKWPPDYLYIVLVLVGVE